jgi:hypothetical protein
VPVPVGELDAKEVNHERFDVGSHRREHDDCDDGHNDRSRDGHHVGCGGYGKHPDA